MPVSEFERRAWDTRTDSNQHTPLTALRIAADDIERSEINPKHVIIVTVEEDEDGDDVIAMFTAGPLTELAMEGALGRAIRLLQR